jgi:hypothetical protein
MINKIVFIFWFVLPRRHKGRIFLNYTAIAYSNRILYFFDAYYDENNVIQLKLRFLSITEKLALLALSLMMIMNHLAGDNIAMSCKGKAYSKQENES